MVNKIDTDKLSTHIDELKKLKTHWDGYTYKKEPIGENCGRTVTQITDTEKMLQQLQNGFVSLLGNSISYMNQRKDSVNTKEDVATQEITK